MAIANAHQPVDNSQKILSSFAHNQLSYIDPKSIKQNSFQLFAIAAFLYGAISQLGKQSTLSDQQIKDYLHAILCEELGLPRHNIEGLVSSINRMMDKYYLLENIYHEGEASAEQWLTNDDADCSELKVLMESYIDFTLMDMKAAGMKSGSTPTPQTQFTKEALATKKSAAPMIISGVLALGAVLFGLYYFLLQ
jgi:hypothetical protein